MATQFGWKSSYEIDHGQIDQQHRHLLDLVNQVLGVADPQAESDRIRESVKALFQYMEDHFKAEEQFMEEIEYPGLPAQRDSHAQLVRDMTALLKNSRDYVELCHELKDTAADWVLQHIQQEDSQIGAFVREMEVQPT